MLFPLLLCVMITVYGQEKDGWQTDLRQQIMVLETAAPAQWPPRIDTLMALANAHPEEWLLQYYAGWAATQLSFKSDKTAAEALCKKAEPFVKKALEMQPGNTETLTLMGYWLSARINAAPSRGASLGGESRSYAEKAIAADSTNPRAWLIKALNIYYTPAIFGGGKKRAKSTVDIVAEKFAAFKPDNALAPRWGQQIFDALLASYR
ncbi:hypothetical protein SAMN04488122_5628 [Chitinophaga arvensicola]|uniref:Uncharacterized protein n=2 Tax=Chitinophaga arvensicola TaxID=29529 RepID=A0A1I0SAV5_9BACT|nr:hypothetical protein SAMN04488122_5628 [Chitinophaga arvensicola]